MAQLFDDQCRDAWHGARWRGLAALWLRVLGDLARTAVVEHFETIKKRRNMLDRIRSLFRPSSAPMTTFVSVFVLVSFLIFGFAAFVAFRLPETYVGVAQFGFPPSKADLALGRGFAGKDDPHLLQAEVEMLQTEAVLAAVVSNLRLTEAWPGRLHSGNSLSIADAKNLLRSRLEVRVYPGSPFIEIRAYGRSASEAAAIANGIVSAYQSYRLEQGKTPIERISDADTGSRPRPVRPNIPLNLAFGASGGMLLALGMGSLAAWAVRRRKPTEQQERGEFGLRGADDKTISGVRQDAHYKKLVDKGLGALWLGFSAVLASLFLAAAVNLIKTEWRLTVEFIVCVFFGLFWGFNAATGFFLIRRKMWARIYLGVGGALLLGVCALTVCVEGLSSSAQHPVLVAVMVFGLLTAGALLWPRKTNAATLSLPTVA